MAGVVNATTPRPHHPFPPPPAGSLVEDGDSNIPPISPKGLLSIAHMAPGRVAFHTFSYSRARKLNAGFHSDRRRYLVLGKSLPAAIRQALENSKFLVLPGSREAVYSVWAAMSCGSDARN